MLESTNQCNLNDGPPPSYNEIIHRIETCDSVVFFSDLKQTSDQDDEEILNNDENNIKIARELFIRKQIEHNYPIRYIAVDSVIVIVLNVIVIALQCVAIQNNAALSTIGSGIWAGLYNILVVILVLLTIKYRSPLLVSFATTMKLFGMIFSFGGFILVNSVAFYHYNCVAVSYYRSCYNKDMEPIHYAIIVLGAPSVIQSIVFFIYFQIKLMGNLKSEYQLRRSSNSHNFEEHDN